MSKLKDLLSTDPNDKNSVWKPLQSAIDGLKNTNAGAAAELINIADVWEECQNALLLASGNVADSSSDELKLSSAQIRLSYNQDLHALSAKLATDTNVRVCPRTSCGIA